MADYKETSNALREELLNSMKVQRERNSKDRGFDGLEPDEMEAFARAFAAIHGNTN